MLPFTKIFSFILLLGFSYEYETMTKYSTYNVYYSDEAVALDIKDFEKGDNIYIQASFYSFFDLDTYDIKVCEANNSNTCTDPTKTKYSSSRSYSGVYYTFYFTVELNSDYNYLIIYPDFDVSYEVTIKHAKRSNRWIIWVIVGVILLVVIIAIIFYIVRRRERAKLNNPINPIQTDYSLQPSNPQLDHQNNQQAYQQNYQPNYQQQFYQPAYQSNNQYQTSY